MSKNVSTIDKFLRIVGFSLYLSFVIFFFFLFFRGLAFSLSLFAISTAYFFLIFLVLTLTRHIHYNIILRRKQLKKAIFSSVYPLAKFKLMNALSWLIFALLAIMAATYFYYNMPIHGGALVVILALSYFYFNIHKIGVHVLKKGIAFDYGQLIVLLQWNEIKKIRLKGNHAIIDLKEKYISRRFYVQNAAGFKKAASKFIKI